MLNYTLVALGGSLGAVLRHFLSGLLFHATSSWAFPIPTFIVNVSGCMLAGIFLALSEHMGGAGGPWRLFLLTGVLGGFTTFSAFGIETLYLLKRGSFGVALAYALGSVAAGLLALYVGTILLGRNYAA